MEITIAQKGHKIKHGKTRIIFLTPAGIKWHYSSMSTTNLKIAETKEEIEILVKEFNLHPFTLEKLKYKNAYRYPFHDEWIEDFGLGYYNKMAHAGSLNPDKTINMNVN